jgi:DNA polymerase sigma
MFDQIIDLKYIADKLGNIQKKMNAFNEELVNYLNFKLDNIEEVLSSIINDFLPLYLNKNNGLKHVRETLTNNFAKFMIKYKRTNLLNIVFQFKHVIDELYKKLESAFEINFEYIYPNNLRVFIANSNREINDELKEVLNEFVLMSKNDFYNYEIDYNNLTISVELNNLKLCPSEKRPSHKLNACHLEYFEKSIKYMIEKTKRKTSNFKKAYICIKDLIYKEIKEPGNILDIVPFGSVTQLSHNIKSDLEVSIMANIVNDEILEELLLILRTKFTDAVKRYTLRTIIFAFTAFDVKVELMFNNYLGVINSDLIRRYCLLDTRVAIIINIIKDWSKNLGINGNFNRYLSSYCYTLMVIFFLQKIFPIIPVLQKNDKCNDLFIEDNENYKHYLIEIMENPDLNEFRGYDYTVSELVYHFFYFYSFMFNEDDYAIDITKENYIYRDECVSFVNGSSICSEKAAYWIVDPFDYSYNPGNYMKRKSSQHNTFKEEMKKAMDKIKIGNNIFINK